MLQPLPLMWQRTSSSWPPMRQWKVVERRDSRAAQFERWFDNRAVSLVVMEACGTAHHWARTLQARGIEVRLLPAQYVRAYVKRNKTDAADARRCSRRRAATSSRCGEVGGAAGAAGPAPHALSVEDHTHPAHQHAARLLPRVRPGGTGRGGARASRRSRATWPMSIRGMPALLRGSMRLMLEEIRLLEARIGQLERELPKWPRRAPPARGSLSVPGIGLLTSTAMVAAVGDPRSFDSGRRYASFLGLDPTRTLLRRQTRASAASPSAATATYARCSPTARARCCARPPWRDAPAVKSTGSKLGARGPEPAPTTTRRPARSPTSSRASPGRCG